MDPARQFEEQGFVVLEDVFDPTLIDALRAEYQRQYPDIQNAPDRYTVGERRLQVSMRLTGPFLSPDLYANAAVLSIASKALNEDFLIDNFSLVSALPGAPAQHRHTDHPDLFPEHVFARSVVKAYAINVAIPLVDLTPETGTTKLFSGSHNRPRDDDQYALPYIARGSCYLVDYRLAHHGTENASNAERPIVYLALARPWFTDLTNYGNNIRINIDASDLSSIPKQHRPLFRRLAAEGAFNRPIKRLFEDCDAEGAVDP